MRRSVAILVLFCGGCQSWTSPHEEPLALPTPQVPPDAAVLEVAFVELPAQDESSSQAVWEVIDETVIPADLRSRFAANGIRWGVVPSTIPRPLQGLIAHSLADPAEAGPLARQLALPGSWSGPSARRLQLRPGRQATIVTDKPHTESMVLLWKEGGKVLGRELPQAECQFVIQAVPAAGGDVTIKLVPRVEFGEPKSRVVGHEGTWMMQTEREQLVLDELSIEVRLSPGQLVAVGSDTPPRAVGSSFFAGSESAGRSPRLLLIRLAGSSSQDLFQTANGGAE